MKCPNCLKVFQDGVKCPACKVDTVLYMGTVQLSDKLYNKGLERLKVGDFFHGIELLTKSLSINKNNVPTRNLLGLALFEVGHVGEALKHWIISRSMLSEDNPAERYIEVTQKSARKLESLNDAVEMYNQALAHIKQKSDDLAIIQLKKAVDINPNFVDALNLLTLCCLIQNDRERAFAAAERVLSIDVLNPVALNYYSILHSGKKPPRLPSAKIKGRAPVKGPYKTIELGEKEQKNFHLAELFMFLIGCAVTAAAMYFLLIPALQRSWETERRGLEDKHAEISEVYRERIAGLEEDYAAHEVEIADLQSDLAGLEREFSVQQRINWVNDAYFSFNQEQLRVAVDSLERVETYDLPSEIQERAAHILEEAYPRLGVEYYNQGLAAFTATPTRDAYMAIVHLENAHRFLDEDATQWNRLLFMLGVLYFDEARFGDANVVLTELYERDSTLRGFTGAERTRFNNMMSELEGLQ